MKSIEVKKSNIFKVLSEAISEGIIIVNDDLKIVASNEAAESMFGFEAGELNGKNLNLLIPREYHKTHDKDAHGFMGNTSPRQMGHGRDLYGRRKDDTIFPVEAGLNPFLIEGNKFVMTLVTDISVRKSQEEQIRKLNVDLEQKVEDRTLALKESVARLEAEVAKRKEAELQISEALRKERELGELKTKFLSLVSHEFKTPLSAILTSSVLIQKYTKEEQQDRRERHLKTITNKVKYLNNILNDFLSVERLESGKTTFKFETFPLSKVVNEVIYSANMLLKNGQRIVYPENIDAISLHFDEKILELSLTNVINNAVKYSPEHSIIDIEVVENDDSLAIKVSDQGIGIPEEEQKFIFNRYFRAENALLNEGTGIGLNIVKGYMDSLNGSISFKSEKGKGSTFTLTIPTKKLPE